MTGECTAWGQLASRTLEGFWKLPVGSQCLLVSVSQRTEGSGAVSHRECSHWRRYGLGCRALELRSQAHELREDRAPKAQSSQCLSQRQRFLPVCPGNGHLGATSTGVGFFYGYFSFRRLHLSKLIHRSPCICLGFPNGDVLQSAPAGALHPPCLSPMFLGSVVCMRAVLGAEHSTLSGKLVPVSRLWPHTLFHGTAVYPVCFLWF